MLSLGKLHPIPPGYWCVPSAIMAITGEDPLSVVIPAVSRHNKENTLVEQVVGVRSSSIAPVLEELGYEVRRSKGPGRTVSAWGDLFPQEVIVVCAENHCMVVHEGRAFDTFTPHGQEAKRHPYATAKVYYAALVRKKV